MASAFDVSAPPPVERAEPASVVPQLQVWQRPGPAAIAALTIAALTIAAISGLATWTVTRPAVIQADLMRVVLSLPDNAPLTFHR